MNEELINSAVSFLNDVNVASAPIAKKVEFLESKGLNSEEIEEALKRAGGNEKSQALTSSSSNGNGQSYNRNYSVPQQPPIDYYNVAPPAVPERTWKDYFIMATATCGVAYGAYHVISKYLIPNVVPPSKKAIDDDKAKIDEEFIKIDKVLDQMSKEQDQIKEANEEKLKEVGVVIENINDFLSKYNKDKLKFDDDLRLMKFEIDSLKNSIEKNMNITKENIKDELSDINGELGSLKQLIRARTEGGDGKESSSSASKIPPVSSIPSASEILKKAKNGTASKNESKTDSSNSSDSHISEGTNVNGIFAAGIPEWQLKHKEREIGTPSPNDEKQRSNTGIPEWQLNQNEKKNDDDLVKESVSKIGVPAWQLNTKPAASE
ncbi:Piso0_002680 [Millerozyma farinosa CBS 7064]|uniref:Peroxisomal membrane protein PEX14 n=1 Tax=Pichia sorbitophila (strain ATCC MYA-4447 / BCRC 22081 / CBS 7064 / NBRC 10061 / NRRL Y-12695) TaxID=559304 RepID=G8YD86_PICSO|nr:Piso0_002680 [Millerozyma farinosa CBS 7064]